MTGIVICADDYGMHPHVDSAIVDLAASGRLSATSVLVDGAGLRETAHWLDGIDIDVGLHLNLTESLGKSGDARYAGSLGRLILDCYRGSVSVSWLQATIRRQLDAFEDTFGRVPAYIDGHQHVHQLPGVRQLLVTELLQRYGDRHAGRKLPWLRNTVPLRGLMRTGLRQWFKAQVIAGLGARRLARLATESGFTMNTGFAGVYDFTRPAKPYEQLMAGWLDSCGKHSLIMCHPSRQALHDDPVGQARCREYAVLASQDMGQMLRQRNLSLVRLSKTVG